jgi:hypothetical protein
MEMSGQLNAPTALPPGMNAGTHRTGKSVSLTAGLDVLDKTKFIPSTGV